MKLTDRVVAALPSRFCHSFRPGQCDTVLEPLELASPELAAKIRAVISHPASDDATSYVFLPANADTSLAHIEAAPTSVPKVAIQEIVNTKTNFSLPDPDTIDRIAAPGIALRARFSDPGPPIRDIPMRNDIENSNLMAAVFSSASGWDNARNLCERQLARSKRPFISRGDVLSARKLYSRFRQTYYREDYDLRLFEEAVTPWLCDATVATINAIASGEPLNSDASGNTVIAELKKQAKAKFEEGYAASDPYNQSILSNDKVFNAEAAGMQQRVYRGLQDIVRPGVFVDYGMSDQQLSDRIAELGIAHRFAAARNFQADISKQDSSHTAATLLVAMAVAADCGAPADFLAYYLEFCTDYKVASRGSDAMRFRLSFNLGSGDPLTLWRNDVMEMTVMAAMYADAPSANWVFKGDDVHSDLSSLRPHPLAKDRNIVLVVLKIDVGLPGYHAGRFHTGVRYVVDPIRAFMKHLARPDDPNVTDLELYNSYISRATDYSHAEIEFLSVACRIMYPFFADGQVDTIIEFMLSIRSYSSFMNTVCHAPIKAFQVVDQTDCAVSVATAMLPRRPKSFYAQFRARQPGELVSLFRSYGVACSLFDSSRPPRIIPDTVYVSPTHAFVLRDLTKDL